MKTEHNHLELRSGIILDVEVILGHTIMMNRLSKWAVQVSCGEAFNYLLLIFEEDEIERLCLC